MEYLEFTFTQGTKIIVAMNVNKSGGLSWELLGVKNRYFGAFSRAEQGKTHERNSKQLPDSHRRTGQCCENVVYALAC